MAGSEHGLRRSLRAGALGGGGLIEILERNREATSDLRTAIVVETLGPGWIRIKDPCNETSYVVLNSSGRTYAPGSTVWVGSASGHPGEVVLGGSAPSGSIGMGGFIVSPRVGVYNPVMPIIPTPSPLFAVGLKSSGSSVWGRAINADGTSVSLSEIEAACSSAELLLGASDPGAMRVAFPSSESIIMLDVENDTYTTLSAGGVPVRLNFRSGVLWWSVAGEIGSGQQVVSNSDGFSAGLDNPGGDMSSLSVNFMGSVIALYSVGLMKIYLYDGSPLGGIYQDYACGFEVPRSAPTISYDTYPSPAGEVSATGCMVCDGRYLWRPSFRFSQFEEPPTIPYAGYGRMTWLGGDAASSCCVSTNAAVSMIYRYPSYNTFAEAQSVSIDDEGFHTGSIPVTSLDYGGSNSYPDAFYVLDP